MKFISVRFYLTLTSAGACLSMDASAPRMRRAINVPSTVQGVGARPRADDEARHDI
jgi:hypothetical protein